MALRDIRPYMLHAHIQWLDDSAEVPHILVLNMPGVVFPSHLRDSQHLLFNVSGEAVQHLEIGDEGVSFSGRFQGRVERVSFPLDAVVAIQNRGASFMVSFAAPESTEEFVEVQVPAAKKPHLSLVGSGNTTAPSGTDAPLPATKRGLHLVKGPEKD